VDQPPHHGRWMFATSWPSQAIDHFGRERLEFVFGMLEVDANRQRSPESMMWRQGWDCSDRDNKWSSAERMEWYGYGISRK
jgi:hypothetical protein